MKLRQSLRNGAKQMRQINQLKELEKMYRKTGKWWHRNQYTRSYQKYKIIRTVKNIHILHDTSDH